MSIIFSMIFLFSIEIAKKEIFKIKKERIPKVKFALYFQKYIFYILSGTPIPKSSIPLFTI